MTCNMPLSSAKLRWLVLFKTISIRFGISDTFFELLEVLVCPGKSNTSLIDELYYTCVIFETMELPELPYSSDL